MKQNIYEGLALKAKALLEKSISKPDEEGHQEEISSFLEEVSSIPDPAKKEDLLTQTNNFKLSGDKTLQDHLNHNEAEKISSENALISRETRLKFLARSAMEFSNVDSPDDVYRFVGDKINEYLEGQCITIVSEFHSGKNIWTIQYIKGLNKTVEKFSKFLGRDIVGISAESPPEVLKMLKDGELVDMGTDIAMISSGKFSKKMSVLAQKLISIKNIYCIAFKKDDQTYGSLTIIRGNHQIDLDKNLIEIFVNHVSAILKKKTAEQDLQLNEERFRQVSSLSTDFAYSAKIKENGSYEFEWVFGAFEKIFGFKPEKLQGKDGFKKHIHPDDFTEAVDKLKRQLKGKRVTSEFRVIGKKGQIKWIRDTGEPVFNKDQSRVIRIIGSASDITEEKNAVLELKKNEEEKKFLATAVMEMSSLNTVKDIFVYIVNKVYEITGNQGIVVTTKYSEDRWSIEAFRGLGKNFEKVTKILGIRIDEMSGPMGLGLLNKLSQGKLVSIGNDLTFLSASQVSKSKAQILLRMLSIDDIQSMSFKRGESIYGNVSIVSIKSQPPIEKNLIEEFTKQASIFIARKAAEEELKTSEGLINLLADSALELAKLPTEQNLHKYLAEKIHKLIDNKGIVVVTESEKASQQWSIKAVYGLGEKVKSVLDLFGKDLLSLTGKMNSALNEQIPDMVLTELTSDLNSVSSGTIPVKLAEKASKLIGLQKIYSLRFLSQYPIFGTLTLLITDKSHQINSELIETFIAQFSIFYEKSIASRALSESEQKYRAIVENNNDGIYIYRDNRFLFTNAKLRELSGYSEKDLQKQNIWDLLHPDDKQRVLEFGLKRAKGEDVPNHYEARVICKNKEVKDCEFSVSIIKYNNDYAVLGVVRDISERKKAEKKIKESEERFKQLFDKMGDGVIIYQPTEDGTNFIIKDMNRAGLKFGNHKKSEILGKTVTEIYPEVKEHGLLEVFQSVNNTGKAKYYTLKNYNEYRLELWVENYVYKLTSGELIAVYNDISEKKKTEEALVESEKRLSNIINHSNELFYIHDLDNQLLYVSQQCEDFFGMTQDEMLINWVTLTTNNPVNKKGVAFTEKAISTGKRQKPYPLELKHKNGSAIWVEVDESPLKDESGDVIGMVGGLSNITQRRLIQDEIDRTKVLLEETQTIGRIGGWEHDPETGSSTFTNEIWDIFETKENEFKCFSDSLEYFISTSAKELNKAMDNAVYNGLPYNLEVELITGNGKHKWVNSIGKPVFEGKKIYKVTGTIQDITDKKNVENALRESEERYKLVVNSSPEGIAIIQKGVLKFVNPAACQLLKAKSEEELIGKPFKVFIHPDFLDKALYRNRILLNDKHIEYPVEDLYIRLDGTTVPVEIMAVKIMYQGKPAIQIIGKDITDRKNADRIKNLALKLNRESKSLTKNDIIKLGLNESELITNSIISFFHLVGKDQNHIIKQQWSEKTLQSCKMDGLPEHFPISEAGIWVECVYNRKPMIHNDYKNQMNNKCPVDHIGLTRLVTVPVFEKENVVAILGVGNNTEMYVDKDVNNVQVIADNIWMAIQRVLAEEDFKNSQQRMEAMSETSKEGLLFSDDGYFIDCNLASQKMFGYNYHELIGMIGTNIIADESRELVKDKLLSGYEEPYEAIALRKDGSVFWAEFRGQMYNYKNKRIRVTSVRDISERKQAEEEIRKYHENLEEIVTDRTKELAEKNRELERMNNLFVGREFRIKELKNKIKDLEQQLSKFNQD